MSGGILIEVLELFALVVVEGVLSKACVSPLVQQEKAASHTGCRMRHGKRGGKAGSMKSRIKYKYAGEGRTKDALLEGLTGGDVLLNSSEAAELECEGVKGAMPRGNW